MRQIIHVDMDAFFAAVEQRDNPTLRGKPVIIGGDPRRRGVVSTASYEARKFGIHSAMPLREAYERCPHAVFLPGDHAKYHIVALQIQEIFSNYTPLVEPVSLDEAFLDVSGCEQLFGDAVQIGSIIKERIADELGLTASVGVAPNKLLAKMASDLEKPDGFVVITPDRVAEVLKDLPVSRLWGVGKATEQILAGLGVRTIGALAALPVQTLRRLFGTNGEELHKLAQGIDNRPVEPFWEPKSVGNEVTFEQDISEPESIRLTLLQLSDHVAWRLRQMGVAGQTVTVKLRDEDFHTITRSRSLPEVVDTAETLYGTAMELWMKSGWLGKRLRLIGVSVSHFGVPGAVQMDLFTARPQRVVKQQELERTLDMIRERHGEPVIRRASLLRQEAPTKKPAGDKRRKFPGPAGDSAN
ncbi:MAG: DNA polymerase IV [Syntrophothermus sp.]